MLAPLDWIVLALSVVMVLGIGAGVAIRRKRALDEREAERAYFLASGNMPWWAVATSVVATSLSAVTFIGGPEKAYRGDLTYLSASIGMVLSVVIVGVVFVPVYYKMGVTTVYEALGARYGRQTQRAASCAFLIGRVMASGARLFAASIPFSLAVFGDIDPNHLQISIIGVALIACVYTSMGGIAAVVWTDMAQLLILLGAAVAAIVLLMLEIPAGATEIIETLRAAQTEAGSNKMTVFDWRWDLSSNFAMPTVLLGWTLFNVAAYGTDQDLAQRLLTCKSARRGQAAIIGAGLVGMIVTGVFMALGLLLFIRYQSPELMGEMFVTRTPEGREVFLEYALGTLPLGLRGVLLAGLFAAALSSLDSALNAMASSTVRDFGFGEGKGPGNVSRASRIAVIGWAVALALFAIGCVWWIQNKPETDLIDLALGVMTYAYSGLLGVFAGALLTRRGSTRSATAALAVGFGVTWIVGRKDLIGVEISAGWGMLFATTAAFLVCVSVPSKPEDAFGG